MPKVNREALGEAIVWFPDLDEQQAILDGISILTMELNQAIDRSSSEIELLREYRTRLIADVVTGKLDVRQAAANLPKENESLDEIDTNWDELDDGSAEAENVST